MATYDAGIVTAYGAAVRGGYTGTYEEFCAQQANYAENAAAVAQAKDDAEAAAEAAAQSAASLEIDATLTHTGQAADAKKTGDEISDLKSDLSILQDDLTGDKIVEVKRERSEMTAGIMGKNGTVTSSTSAGYVNTPIEVSEGELLTAQKGYYSNGELTVLTGVQFRACAYFADSTYTYANNGFDTAKDSITVPSGVKYIQPSFSGIMTGTYTVVIVSKTTANGQVNQKIIDLINGEFPTKDLANKYACAIPITDFRMTIGIAEKWYKKSMATPPTDFVVVTGGYSTTELESDGSYFANESAISSTNGYIWKHYDNMLELISEYTGSAGIGGKRRVLAENLSSCSLLAIGDSTVDHDTMTGTMLEYFTSKGLTLTLLGTLGSAYDPLNRNEGRAGWTTADYLTDTVKNGYTNPFYNPVSEEFDFSYYMTQQGYSGVDFIVLQLGINDLYGSTTFVNIDITSVWDNLKVMLDSIFTYNASAKVILNLPTTPNSNQSAHPVPEFLYRNRVVRYNEYALAQAQSVYGDAKVRPSYCHLILDPATDINDNVHPTPTGYGKMAMEVINQINVWQNGY